MSDRPDEENFEDPELPTLSDSPIVRWLIGLNMIAYAIDAGLTVVFKDAGGTQRGTMGLLTYFGSFNIIDGINGWQVWRLATYQFLHANLWHLGMNMMALFVFGPLIEKWWGARRFLVFYLLCGACGAWLMAMFAFNPDLVNAREAWLVGASGSIFGVLVAAAMIYPKLEVKLLIPPMWVTTRKLALIFIGLSIAAMFVDFNFGGNAAHIGGAIFGYILVKRPWTIDFADRNAPQLEPPGKQGSISE